MADVRKQAEEDLLSQLKRQAAAHSQHLREVLSVQEEDYNHKLKMILGEGIAVERRKLESKSGMHCLVVGKITCKISNISILIFPSQYHSSWLIGFRCRASKAYL